MLHTLTSQLGLILLVLVCLLAIARGGPAERIGALLVAANWGGLLVCQALTGEVVPDIPILASDLFLALGFLFLAIRYASLWLGAGMLFQGAAFAVHLMRITGPPGGDRIYLLVVAALSYGVLAVLAGGAVGSWRRRRHAKSAAAFPQGDLVTGP